MSTYSYPNNQGASAGALPVYIVSGGLGTIAPYTYTPLGYQQITSLGTATLLTVPNNALYAYINVTNAPVRYRDDGVAPTATIGMPVNYNLQLIYSGSLSTIQFIQQSAGAILDILYYK